MFFYYDPREMGLRFEILTEALFRKLGFSVFFNYEKSVLQPVHNYFDVGVSKSKEKYAVEVKSSTSSEYRMLKRLENPIEKLISNATSNGMIPVLMVFSFISDSEKKEYRGKYKELKILDLANILFLAKQTDMYDSIVAELPYSVGNFNYEPVDRDTLDLVSANTVISVKDQSKEICPLDLSNCPSGKEGANKFEQICSDVLEKVFSDDLALWKRQPNSDFDLYRFDLLCRIKNNNENIFWNIVERHFNSKYIVFEFKNYRTRITQKEIYTTERYLYNKALRNVAVIIARQGFDEHSLWATKGCLRENGKLIILLDINDLDKMIELKNKQEDPSSILLEKLDDLLIELEK